jgi:hypothetical protein
MLFPVVVHPPPLAYAGYAATLVQVLSDPQRRDIYDVYGSQGLSAGLEVRFAKAWQQHWQQ